MPTFGILADDVTYCLALDRVGRSAGCRYGDQPGPMLTFGRTRTKFTSAFPSRAPTFAAMERTEAVIGKTWHEFGIAHLLVVRRRSDGSADAGFFLVDIWCLGVKDAFSDTDVPESELESYIAERMPESGSERIHPACAKKLIEGAIAYAERLGIAPHRDFRKARRVLSGIDASLCPSEFTYGHDGRPCYVRGPHDTEERVDRVLALLTAHCGEDGYDFEDPSEAEADDIQDVREDLMAWLDAEPEEVPRFYWLSGMMTALQICPHPVPPTKLLEALWGPEGRDWADEEELKDFSAWVADYWNYLGELVQDAVAPDAPPGNPAIDIWPDDLGEDTTLPFMVVMVDWARGFMQTTKLWPEAWGDALHRPELAEHWEMVRWWAEFVGTGNKDRIADAADANPPRTIGASVTALARALRPAPPSAG